MDTATWRLLRTIKTYMVEPQNELTESRGPEVPNNSGVQVTMKHDSIEIFDRDKFNRRFVGKSE